MRSLSSILLVSLLVSACGGPTLDSKAANAVQTLLATSVEAFLLGGGSTTVSVPCSGGGTLTYSPPTSINPGDTSIDLPVSFDACIIKVCGDEVTFTASGQTLLSLTGLDPSDVGNLIGGDAIIGTDDQFLEIEILSSKQGVEGFLDGKVDFAYRMRIIGNNRGLSEISILESSRGKPLTIQGRQLKAPNLAGLADRC